MTEPLEVFSSCSTIHTNDFSTMYTMFPIDEMEASVTVMIRKALRYAAKTFFNDEAKWDQVLFEGRKPETNEGHWTLTKVNTKSWNFTSAVEVLKFILKNSYYVNAFGLVHQVIGVGMGSEPAQPIANLALAHREILWIDDLLRRNIDIKYLFSNFKHYTRYIDDMASDTPLIPNNYFDMPLVKTGSTDTDPTVDYLIFTFVRRQNQSLLATIKEKQRHFPIPLIRYPGNLSTITEECKAGCVIGGLVSIYRLIGEPSIFEAEIHRFFSLLCARGFLSRHIRRGVQKFTARNVKPEFRAYIYNRYLRNYVTFWPNQKNLRSTYLAVPAPPSYEELLNSAFAYFRNAHLQQTEGQCDDSLDRVTLYSCTSSNGHDLHNF